MLWVSPVVFPSADSPVPRLTCARGRPGWAGVACSAAGSLRPGAGRSRPLYFLRGERASERAGGAGARWAPPAAAQPEGGTPGHLLHRRRLLTWPCRLRHRSTWVRLRSRDPSDGSGRSPPSGTVIPSLPLGCPLPSCASLPAPPPPPGSLLRNPGPAGTCLLKEAPPSAFFAAGCLGQPWPWISQNTFRGITYPPPSHFTENSEGWKFY